ncbi:unnamed protein product [Blepharisma stoltei]|uniref:Uncharacterized protein n=1 Tax=Blepharisma stoltei TaxID=1481888 RepID=A0AAU9IFF4_9CILI|nr:unnamed protein product [Blepharisma stoltei]
MESKQTDMGNEKKVGENRKLKTLKEEIPKKIKCDVEELKIIVERQEEILENLTHSFKDSKSKSSKLQYLLSETHDWKNSLAERNERLAMRFQKCIPAKKEIPDSSNAKKDLKIDIEDRLSENDIRSIGSTPKSATNPGNRIKFRREPKTPAESLFSKSYLSFLHI